MPKDTFFKLPEEKRTLICDVAIDEFAAYPFDQASINRIVAKAGIAKGSFYQYFKDKKDLFLHITHLITQEKTNYISPILCNPKRTDFFSMMREFLLARQQFANDHPRYAAIRNSLLAHKEAPIFEEATTDNLPLSSSAIETLLERAIARGEIREDIDIKMFAYMIASMSVDMVEYCSKLALQGMDASAIEAVDAFVDLFRNGIGVKDEGGRMPQSTPQDQRF
jgi:AcrR family transcriptional regulator